MMRSDEYIRSLASNPLIGGQQRISKLDTVHTVEHGLYEIYCLLSAMFTTRPIRSHAI